MAIAVKFNNPLALLIQRMTYRILRFVALGSKLFLNLGKSNFRMNHTLVVQRPNFVRLYLNCVTLKFRYLQRR